MGDPPIWLTIVGFSAFLIAVCVLVYYANKRFTANEAAREAKEKAHIEEATKKRKAMAARVTDKGCQHCGADTKLGRTYHFHYGKYVGHKVSADRFRVVHEHEVTLIGSKDVFVCDQCVVQAADPHYRNWLGNCLLGIVATPIALFFSLSWPFFWYLARHEGILTNLINSFFFILIGLTGIALAVRQFSRMHEMRQALKGDQKAIAQVIEWLNKKEYLDCIGDQLAIDCKRPTMEGPNVDAFFTRFERGRLVSRF